MYSYRNEKGFDFDSRLQNMQLQKGTLMGQKRAKWGNQARKQPQSQKSTNQTPESEFPKQKLQDCLEEQIAMWEVKFE